MFVSASAEWGGKFLNDFKEVDTKNGSSQGKNMALTGAFVPSSLDNDGWRKSALHS
jgi:hypothetical protein